MMVSLLGMHLPDNVKRFITLPTWNNSFDIHSGFIASCDPIDVITTSLTGVDP